MANIVPYINFANNGQKALADELRQAAELAVGDVTSLVVNDWIYYLYVG